MTEYSRWDGLVCWFDHVACRMEPCRHAHLWRHLAHHQLDLSLQEVFKYLEHKRYRIHIYSRFGVHMLWLCLWFSFQYTDCRELLISISIPRLQSVWHWYNGGQGFFWWQILAIWWPREKGLWPVQRNLFGKKVPKLPYLRGKMLNSPYLDHSSWNKNLKCDGIHEIQMEFCATYVIVFFSLAATKKIPWGVT
jgi:hypothetical protein